MIHTSNINTEKRFTRENRMTINRASTYLGVSRPTLYRWIDAGLIAPIYFGKRRYFFKSELDKALENGLGGSI
jgi:excisionase family DNA binding protein